MVKLIRVSSSLPKYQFEEETTINLYFFVLVSREYPLQIIDKIELVYVICFPSAPAAGPVIYYGHLLLFETYMQFICHPTNERVKLCLRKDHICSKFLIAPFHDSLINFLGLRLNSR